MSLLKCSIIIVVSQIWRRLDFILTMIQTFNNGMTRFHASTKASFLGTQELDKLCCALPSSVAKALYTCLQGKSVCKMTDKSKSFFNRSIYQLAIQQQIVLAEVIFISFLLLKIFPIGVTCVVDFLNYFNIYIMQLNLHHDMSTNILNRFVNIYEILLNVIRQRFA